MHLGTDASYVGTQVECQRYSIARPMYVAPVEPLADPVRRMYRPRVQSHPEYSTPLLQPREGTNDCDAILAHIRDHWPRYHVAEHENSCLNAEFNIVASLDPGALEPFAAQKAFAAA